MAALKSAIAVVVGDGQFRIELDRDVVVGDGAFEIALKRPYSAAIAERAGEARIDPDRLFQVGHSGIELVLFSERMGAVAIGDRE